MLTKIKCLFSSILFSHGNAVDLGQMCSFYYGLGYRVKFKIFVDKQRALSPQLLRQVVALNLIILFPPKMLKENSGENSQSWFISFLYSLLSGQYFALLSAWPHAPHLHFGGGNWKNNEQ